MNSDDSSGGVKGADHVIESSGECGLASQGPAEIHASRSVAAKFVEVPDGRETILVVEDEENVRILITAVLEQQGYKVLAAKGGQEAISILSEYPGQIHLLLTDVLLPDVNGQVVAKRAVERRPNTQILYISGLGEDAIPPGEVPFLQKPFRLEELTLQIKKMLKHGDATQLPASS